MNYNNSKYNDEEIYSKKVRAGKKRTYFFDVRSTKTSDYYLTITESKKRAEGEGYEKHKLYIYKEDFNKFLEGLTDTINHVKTKLLPDFDFDAFNFDKYEDERNEQSNSNYLNLQDKDTSSDSDDKTENW